MNILIVDDEEDYLFLSKKLIERIEKKIIVKIADSAMKAIKLLKKQEYDVIISDYQIPEVNGLNS